MSNVGSRCLYRVRATANVLGELAGGRSWTGEVAIRSPAQLVSAHTRGARLSQLRAKPVLAR